MSPPAALALHGLTKRYDNGFLALDDLDLVVPDGAFFGLLGPNGAGKTTLMHLAGAMAQPSSGAVEVLGARLGAVDVRALRERIGFVDARLARSLRGHLTGLQTVLTGAFNTIIPQVRRLTPGHEQRARALMALVSADALVERRFEDCSQGERQRLLLARALMADPELLLLDEPAAGLDLPGREGLVGALVSLARDRPALPTVTVTHHLEEIPPSCTHALLLRGGRVLASGPVAEVLTSALVSDCFGVPVEVSGHRGRWAATVRHADDVAA
jgi:iron complex transport system ATP-binding protein